MTIVCATFRLFLTPLAPRPQHRFRRLLHQLNVVQALIRLVQSFLRARIAQLPSPQLHTPAKCGDISLLPGRRHSCTCAMGPSDERSA